MTPTPTPPVPSHPPTEIQILDLRFRGAHGVEPHERIEGRDFRVSAHIALKSCAAHASDDLSQTLDYAGVCALIYEIGTTQSFHLVERLAEVIAQTILAFPLVASVTLTVHKHALGLPGLPLWVGVQIHRQQHPTTHS